jgi:hypothetical protein
MNEKQERKFRRYGRKQFNLMLAQTWKQPFWLRVKLAWRIVKGR